MTLRKPIFWLHLAAGLISGLSIGIMCFTGTLLAFEKELTAWAERDARRVEIPAAGATRLPLDELQRRLRAAHPEAKPTSIVMQNDPRAAVTFSAGRTNAYHVNPYTGEVRQPKSTFMGRFMHSMVDWHRYLGFHGDTSRPRGKLVNGVCNVAFCVLAITGLYLWMPRTWSWRALRPAIWFTQNSSSKARDWNWHNTIGFWCAPVLIVLTLTAMPISFRWAGNLIYTLTGTEAPPASASRRGSALPPVEVSLPAPGARPLSQDALFTAARQAVPAWKTITLRPSAPGTAAVPGRNSPNGTAPSLSPTFTVRETGTWPRTANTTISLDPYTGEILRRTGYADMNAALQVRSWTRFLHTGEALGAGGQFVAGLACLGGLFLVYTGFALSWRRFFGKAPNPASPFERTSADKPLANSGRTAARAE